MLKNPKVSILVPICNVERYLRECLNSLVNQTLREIEIICINDGSTDSSLSIIREYERRDTRIVVIDKPNSGYGDSMNKGIELARGEYIGIVESDDFASLNMFETLYKEAVKNDLDVVRSNYYAHRTKEDSSCDYLIENLAVCGSYDKVFHQSIILVSLCASLQFGQAFIKVDAR
ncbi:MAG: glycosyltransferase family 2 protein [Collinsella sp.]